MRANQDWERLSSNDVLRLRALVQAAMNYFETLYYADRRGEVQAEVWESRIARMRASREIGFEEVWESLAPFYGASFRAFDAREVLAGGAASDSSRELLQAGGTEDGR